jgi:hypothetical protein
LGWARIETSLARHPKMADLSTPDCWGYLELVLWCVENRNDGAFNGRAMVTVWSRVGSGLAPLRSRDRSRRLSKLVEVGLLDPVPERGPDAYQVHDFLDYQISREADEQRRELQRQRQARYDAKQRAPTKRRGKSDASEKRQEELADATSDASSRARRYDTTPPLKGGRGERAAEDLSAGPDPVGEPTGPAANGGGTSAAAKLAARGERAARKREGLQRVEVPRPK